jgi:hypothetical protein
MASKVNSLSITAPPAAVSYNSSSASSTSSASSIAEQRLISNKCSNIFKLPGNQLQHLHALSVHNLSFVLFGNSTDLKQFPPVTAAVGNSIFDPNSSISTTSSGSSSRGGGLLTACIPVSVLSQLRSLQLENFTTPDLQQLTYLSRATNLTLLRLSHIKDKTWAALHPSTGSALLSDIIPQLTALRDLSCNLSVQSPGLASISHLQQPQRLQLSLEPWTDFSSTLSTISTALTALQLSGPRSIRLFGPHALGGSIAQLSHFAQLGLLQHLELTQSHLDPSVLTLCPQLQYLVLDQLIHLQVHLTADGTYAAAVATLLGAIASMRQLQHLHLVQLLPDGLAACTDITALSSLTASSQLTELKIEGWARGMGLSSSRCAQLLPPGALQMVFPAGRQLPALRVLQLHCAGRTPVADTDDLVSIGRCCTALQYLSLREAVQHIADPRSLLELPPGLQFLTVTGGFFSDDSSGAAAVVASHLTQLTALQWG